MINIDTIKSDFPIFQYLSEEGEALHYLDNAATSHKPASVIAAMSDCYAKHYGPVSRGLYGLGEQATLAYDGARQTVASFIGASTNNLVFTRSATESLNMVAQGAIKPLLKAGDEVWVSVVDHHANYLPWLRICNETGATLRVIELDEQQQLAFPSEQELAHGNVKCIALPLISNVLGHVGDIQRFITFAKQAGVATVIDAAQGVAHHQIDVNQLGCDFLAFSGHKMFGPTGIGALYIASEHIANFTPTLVGGGMVDWVGESIDSTQWTSGVQGLEAGSPNLAGALGLAAAVDYVLSLDRKALHAHIANLAKDCAEAISQLGDYVVYGTNENWQSGIVTFYHPLIHPHDIGQLCADNGVAVRAGHHCAQPLMQYWGQAATTRVSFSIYNTQADIDALLKALKEAEALFL